MASWLVVEGVEGVEGVMEEKLKGAKAIYPGRR